MVQPAMTGTWWRHNTIFVSNICVHRFCHLKREFQMEIPSITRFVWLQKLSAIALCMDPTGYGLGQWEKSSHSNASSHWVSLYPERALLCGNAVNWSDTSATNHWHFWLDTQSVAAPNGDIRVKNQRLTGQVRSVWQKISGFSCCLQLNWDIRKLVANISAKYSYASNRTLLCCK